MATHDRRDQTAPLQLPRRTLVAAGAWTVPVVAAATAAPAYAASPCQTDYTYVLNWGSTQSQFNKPTVNTATATATTAAVGAQAMSIGFSSALITNANGNANGYTLDPTYNLTVPGPSGGGTAPNVTNLGAIVAGGSERGLCLQHSASTTAVVTSGGQPDRGQRLTMTFPRAVTNLSFWLVDIDSTTTGYWDRVRFLTAPNANPSNDANVNGAGFGASPFRYGTTQTNSNIDENAAGARTKVTFAGPILSLVLEYWNASYTSGTSIQRLFLHDLQYTARGC